MSRRRRVPDELADFTEPPKKRADRKLGPSDSSDTGADMMGLGGEDDTSDREGTGERASVEDSADSLESADIEPDRVVRATCFDGATREVQATAYPLVGGNDELHGVVTVFWQLTDRNHRALRSEPAS